MKKGIVLVVPYVKAVTCSCDVRFLRQISLQIMTLLKIITSAIFGKHFVFAHVIKKKKEFHFFVIPEKLGHQTGSLRYVTYLSMEINAK